MNKFEKFAISGPEEATTSNNNYRKIKLKNPHKANLKFKIDIETFKSKCDSFRIAYTDSNSPLTKFQKLPQKTLSPTLKNTMEIQS